MEVCQVASHLETTASSHRIYLGDYDGDTLEVFWDPILVSHFKNADPVYAHEPDEVQAALSKNPESVRQFMQRTSSSSDDVKLVEMQQYLLGSLRNVSRVGTYSNWWMTSAYKVGYAHPDTIFLAYMCVRPTCISARSEIRGPQVHQHP